MEFTVYLGEGLFNSGMLGFKRVLDDNDLPYEIVNYNSEQDKANGTGLRFDSKIFESFTDAYLKTLIEQAGKDAPFHTLEQNLTMLKSFDFSQEDAGKKLKECKTFVLRKMDSNSYKSAYTIIESYGNTYDFLASIAEIKKAQPEELVSKLIDALTKMCEFKDFFIVKDVLYTNVQHFWSGVSFLHNQQNVTPYDIAYSKTFIKPINDYVTNCKSSKKRKTTQACCCCGKELITKEQKSMSWINNMGIDYAKKKSPYWNLVPDVVLCPVCQLIYSCVPLGFTTKSTESYFVNLNSSICSLDSANNFDDSTDKSFGYYNILRSFIEKEQQTTANRELKNIQVLRRSGDNLYQNILSKDKLMVISNCSRELSNLTKKRYLKDKDWHNLFDEVVMCIFGYSSLYGLFNEQIRLNIDNSRVTPTNIFKGKYCNYLTDLEKIQINLFDKGDKEMKEKLMDSGFISGKRLRTKMLGPDRNENKIKSLSFKLCNALKGRNINMFLDTLMRQYLSEGDNMPKELTDAMKTEEDFLCYGYAYLNGLNSYTQKDGENKEVNDNE